jgi:hypothetical protein
MSNTKDVYLDVEFFQKDFYINAYAFPFGEFDANS